MPKRTLAKSIDDMNPGDTWKSENYSATMEPDGTIEVGRIDHGILHEYGEIVRVAPAVLTARDIIVSNSNLDGGILEDLQYSYQVLIDFMGMSKESGRLERDLEVRGAIDWCEENYLPHKDLFIIMRNLKPLNPDD